MVKNYFGLAIRNLARNKAFSALNIIGISIGMAAAILILSFVLYETSYDAFHKNAANIYRIEVDTYRNGVFESSTALTPPAMGRSFADNFPEVENFGRIASNPGKTIVTCANENLKEEKAYLVDPTLFNIFTIQLLKGNSTNPLADPHDVMISDKLAEKLFGLDWQRKITLPKTVQLHSQGLSGTFNIESVFKSLPANSHFNPGILASKSYINELVGDRAGDANWDFNFFYTYIQLRPQADVKNIQAKLNAFVKEERKESLQSAAMSLDFHLRPITDIHLNSNIQFELESNGDKKIVYAVGLIGFVILLVAWINFINLSTARSIKRAREVGVRKVLGAVKGQLIFQFIVEGVVINAISLMIALVLVHFVKPVFSEIAGIPLRAMQIGELASHGPSAWSLVSVLVSGAILSGLYPSVILSRFNPVKALKGNIRASGGINIRRLLVILQFSVALLAISGTWIIYKQINFMRSTDLGANIESTLIIEAPENRELFQDGAIRGFQMGIQNFSFIKGITMSSVVPGQEVTFRSYNLESSKTKSQINCGIIGIDPEFIRNYDLTLVAGKNFKDQDADLSKVILNEAAAAQLGFENMDKVIGTKLIHQNQNRKEELIVEGIVKNYHHRSLQTAYEPIMFRHGQNNMYYSIRFKPQGWEQAGDKIELLSAEYGRFFPGNPFVYFFLDQQFDSQYRTEMRFGKLFLTFSILAVLISLLGLLGLSTYMMNLRLAEIGIRKVLGASAGNITLLLLRDYLYVFMVSIFLAVPIVWIAGREWLGHYAFKLEIGFFLIASPVFGIMIATLAALWFQSILAASKNPIDIIRNE